MRCTVARCHHVTSPEYLVLNVMLPFQDEFPEVRRQFGIDMHSALQDVPDGA